MMAFWIIGTIVLYLLIGFLLNVAMVRLNITDPYDRDCDGVVLATLLLWLPLFPIAIFLIAEQQLIKYLRGLKK